MHQMSPTVGIDVPRMPRLLPSKKLLQECSGGFSLGILTLRPSPSRGCIATDAGMAREHAVSRPFPRAARQGKTSRAAGGEHQLATPCGRTGKDSFWPLLLRIRRRFPRFEPMFFPQQMSEEPQKKDRGRSPGLCQSLKDGGYAVPICLGVTAAPAGRTSSRPSWCSRCMEKADFPPPQSS